MWELLDRTAIENILNQLEKAEALFQGYHFYRDVQGMRLLGKGGSASVYEMFDEGNPGKRYALKVIGLTKEAEGLKRFYQSIQLQQAMSEYSPNIVRILGVKEVSVQVDEEGEFQGIALAGEGNLLLQLVLMEKLQGLLSKDKLGNVVPTQEALYTETEVIRFAGQIGKVLCQMHQKNILHRDIKLENVFWDEETSQYKLGDFGIARHAKTGQAETMVYTDGYGAPEVCFWHEAHYNATADIYSLGITLYLLLNDLCFPGSEGYYVNMVQYSPEFILPAARNASTELNRIVCKMCSYYREDRYQSMTQVLADLNRLGEDKNATENIWEVESVEFVTETYREEKVIKREPAEGMPDWKKRLRQRQKNAEKGFYYKKQSRKYLLMLTLCFWLFFFSLLRSQVCVRSSTLGMVTAVALVEAVFLRVKEFHISFGLVTIATFLYSIMQVGLQIPHVILLLCLISGSEVVLGAGALGNLIWLGMIEWLHLTGESFFYEYKLAWLFLTGIFIVCYKQVVLAEYGGHMKEKQVTYFYWCWQRLPLWLIAAEMVLRLWELFPFLPHAVVIEQLHPALTGIILFLRNRRISEYIIYRDEEGNIIDDEFMDQR